MEYLDDIKFQETEEEEGREATAREAEKEEDVFRGPTIPPVDFSHSPSPSAHPVNSVPVHSGLSSASTRSHCSSTSTASSNRIYEWTIDQKRDLAAYAEDVCRDMEVPPEKQKMFIENVQVR